jgi:alkylation response protein AidB-like acyl-CoA dehydrogenase
VFWCQGYSEPGAGSDLAGLKTRAVRDGDHYVVNGSKIWTTMAHWADMMFCLARTDADAARPQEGISFLLLDMKQPGVTVRPIISIDGAHHLNEVFFDDVRVPVSERVGEENRGWTYAKFLLGHERMLSAETGKARRLIGKIRRIAARLPHANGRGVLADDARFRDRIARLEIRVLALEWTTLRMLDAAMEGAGPGAEASLLKIRGSELVQAITELATDVLGLYGIPFDVRLLEAEAQGIEIGPDGAAGILAEFLYHRAPTIWGGSNEVQRNILAKHALGL